MENRSFTALWNRYLYYGLVFVLSLITLFAVPMLGSEAGLQWRVPNTAVGWIVWTVSNLCASTLNVLMFHSFIKQAKVNVQDDPNYQEANRLLLENEIEDAEVPLSPRAWHGKQYRNKGISLFVFTLLGTIGLGQAILTFDGAKFLSQVIVLLMGLIFGVMQMKSTEDYWTNEYLAYAKMKVQEKEELEEKAQTTSYIEQTSITTIERTRELPLEKGE